MIRCALCNREIPGYAQIMTTTQGKLPFCRDSHGCRRTAFEQKQKGSIERRM